MVNIDGSGFKSVAVTYGSAIPMTVNPGIGTDGTTVKVSSKSTVIPAADNTDDPYTFQAAKNDGTTVDVATVKYNKDGVVTITPKFTYKGVKKLIFVVRMADK
ncbi:hypothetical protein B0H16DRAFT_1888329 [Mycena metata]|uniref:Uncharacterized protein n=1 Tax=Mycena metata TaxID=1033252 RepID=A0AAD7IUJ0_9AGAR|nr:hypothetical protein B0H16DRAFT_1888329 [Mycena metata]